MKVINSKILLRNDLKSVWDTSPNDERVLSAGEVGVEIDDIGGKGTRRIKIGDGDSSWSQLPYVDGGKFEIKTTSPTSSNTGHDPGTVWINTNIGKIYTCLASGIWVEIPTFNSIATIDTIGLVRPRTNLDITPEGFLDATALSQPAYSNKIALSDWEATSTLTGDEAAEVQYGKYRFTYSFGAGGIGYVEINYAAEVVKTIGTNKYIQAPCTIVKDKQGGCVKVYTDEENLQGYLILTSGGENDSQQSGHQIYTGDWTSGQQPLIGRPGLRFSDGLVAVDSSNPAETRVSVDTASILHSALKDLNTDTYLHLTTKEKETAIGINTTADGNGSHTEGVNGIASGDGAHVEGYSELTTTTFGTITGLQNEAIGKGSHAEGIGTKAIGDGCHAEGTVGATSEDPATAEQRYTTSDGRGAHAEGCGTIANGKGSHSEGYNTVATGTGAHAEGRETQAKKFYSHAEGQKTIADGNAAHAEGYRTEAIGAGSHTEGIRTTALGDNSHAEGFSTYKFKADVDGNTAQDIENNWSNRADKFSIAFGDYSHVEGQDCLALGTHAHAEGQECIASGTYSHAEGQKTKATNTRSHAEGRATLSSGNSSHAEGGGTQATGDNAHAEGYGTKANGQAAHAEGMSTIADANGSHAEGRGTRATGNYSHAEGQECIASGSRSHAEGYQTTATEHSAHAEGRGTIANNLYTHAQGYETIASGISSHAEGKGTIAASENQHAQGRYNIEDSAEQYAHIVGGGTSSARKNIHTLDWSGNAIYAGKVKATDFELASGTLLKKSDVINALNSNSTDSPLSAYQGKVLKGIIDGKEIGTSYNNISALVTAIKGLSQNWYWVGHNLFILTQDVPDFWISQRMSTSGEYTYTNDADFITAVDEAVADGGLHIGYYKIGRSELAKVDLLDYAQKETEDWESDRVLVSNSSGKVAVSSITSTKLGYLTDVTSNIQAQFTALRNIAATTQDEDLVINGGAAYGY